MKLKRTLHLFRSRVKNNSTPCRRRARFESLECRELLSVTAGGEASSEAPAICSLQTADIGTDSALVEFPRPTALTQLAAPSISSVTGGGGNSHRIAWNEVEGASLYQLDYSANGKDWDSLTASGGSAEITGLVCGNRMRYRVRALSSGSYSASAWSATKSLYVCPADVDGDGFIGPGDRALISQAWFSNEGAANWNPACDIDGDGFVGPGDISFVSAAWFRNRDEIAVTSLGLVYYDEAVMLWNTEDAAAPVRDGDLISVGYEKNSVEYSFTVDGVWDSYILEYPENPGTYRYFVTVTRPAALYPWEGTLTVVIPEKEVQPSDLTVSMAWDSSNHGLALSWTAKKDFQKDAVIDLYFASGASYSGIVDDAPVWVTIPAGTKSGASGTILVGGADLYTTVPVNTFDTVIACLGQTVISSIADVTLSISSGVKQAVVSQSTYDAIKYACRAVGKGTIRLTSGWRTAQEQADAMFYNMARPDVKGAIAYQYSLYGNAGDQVIAVFEQHAVLHNYDNAAIRAHSAEIITLMADKILELDAKGIRVSRHCVSEATYRAHNIMDVSRSGFDSTNIPIFTAAAKRMGCDVVRDEPANGCLHLEF
ncbi:MAG: hypothetical protein IJJ20_05590 [Thermoguttaceae bacterium]|nr:hypothetical protein [Thermoguttaceae bacterium]